MNNPRRQFSEKIGRDRFDMIVTFKEEAQAQAALNELRNAGFGPQEAILLRPEEASSPTPLAIDGYMKFSPKELIADRAIAIWIIICTEFAVGVLAGATLGWILTLFIHAPDIGPAWFWMLILGGAFGVGGILLGSWEWRKWTRQLEELRKQVAIGMRFSARNPAAEIQQALSILEHHGGLTI